MNNLKKIIVIGSGFGGIAAALRLKSKGHDVTLIEKQNDLGGRARVFKKDKFVYDGGPTVITAPYLFEELFSLFNKNISDYVKIVPLDLWYRFVFSNGDKFDYNGNDKSMEEQVKKFNPSDYDGYKNLVNFTEKIFNSHIENCLCRNIHEWCQGYYCAGCKHCKFLYPTHKCTNIRRKGDIHFKIYPMNRYSGVRLMARKRRHNTVS